MVVVVMVFRDRLHGHPDVWPKRIVDPSFHPDRRFNQSLRHVLYTRLDSRLTRSRRNDLPGLRIVASDAKQIRPRTPLGSRPLRRLLAFPGRRLVHDAVRFRNHQVEELQNWVQGGDSGNLHTRHLLFGYEFHCPLLASVFLVRW